MEFDVGTILTVTTKRLLTKPKGESDNGINDLYRLLSHMTGDEVFTHTLGRFSDECKPVLLEMFPELGLVDLDRLDLLLASRGGSAVPIWKLYIKDIVKDTYDIPENCVAHICKNPSEEMADILSQNKEIL